MIDLWSENIGETVSHKTYSLEQTISERFSKVVRSHDQRIAVVSGQHSVTYEALHRNSNRVAHALLSHGDIGQGPVALLLDHDIQAVTAFMGVIKAGLPLIPLDPGHPSSRNNLIIRDAGVTLILTNRRNLPHLEEVKNSAHILMIEEAMNNLSDQNVSLHLTPDMPALIFYTSGSTGQPKGSVSTHRFTLQIIHCLTNTYKITPEDRQPQFFSISFSRSRTTILGSLLNGASLFMESLDNIGLPNLAEWLIRNRITLLSTSAAFLRTFAAFIDPQVHKGFPDIRLVLLSGETATSRDADLWKTYFSDASGLVHLLGSSEAGVISCYFIDKDTSYEEGILPVGYAAENMKIVILDDQGTDIGIGRVGEVAVESPVLASGYWRRPDLTKAVFLPGSQEGMQRYLTRDLGILQPDGCLTIIGRKDFQVKIRGNTVQLTEIEAALCTIDGVSQAAVAAWRGSVQIQYSRDLLHDNPAARPLQLVAYIAPENGALLNTGDIRHILTGKLPSYMIPAGIILVDALPLTPAGKVDRSRLPAPDSSRPALKTEYIAPQDDIEKEIVAVCEEILNVSPVGIRDDFVDLGIDSLSYFELLLAVQKKKNLKLRLDGPITARTVEELSGLFRRLSADNITSYGGQTSENPRITDMRRSRFRFKRMVRHLLSAAGVRLITYGQGIGMLSWWCSRQWAWKLFYRAEVALIKETFSSISTTQSEDDAVRIGLLSNLFRKWIYGALKRSSPDEFKRWITVKGFTFFLESFQRGKGVILLFPHSGLGYLLLMYLLNEGYAMDQFLIIGNNPKAARHLDMPGLEQRVLPVKNYDLFFYDQMLLAMHTLEKGGILLVAGDGYRGTSGPTFSFHKRDHAFRAGAAHLSLRTGADAIPAFVSCDIHGQIIIEFLEPLKADMPETPAQPPIISLIRQYASLLEKHWSDHPGNIMFWQMRRFLSLPMSKEAQDPIKTCREPKAPSEGPADKSHE